MDSGAPTADAPAAAETATAAGVEWRRLGRLLLLAVLYLYVVAVLYPHFTAYRPHWARVGVFDSIVPFADMRSLTSAWDCTRQGQQVLVQNHCDPLGWRPANYPSLWLDLSHLGLGQGATTALGLAAGGVFLASILALTGPITLVEGLVWGALVTSPSVMLGVDRGNVDILLFALLVLALLAVTRTRGAARVAGCALLELAALLKLFPVLASAAVLHWRRGRRALLALGALLAVFAAYALDRRHELETIQRVVPKSIDVSFGAGVVVDGLRSAFGNDAFLVSDRPLAIAVLGLASLAAVAAAVPPLRRLRGPEPEPSTRLPWFWAGAAVCVGTWAFTENSFDYRLVFALLAVPQLLEWARQARPAVPLPRTALVLLFLALWLSDRVQPISRGLLHPWLAAEAHFPFDELLVWALVLYLAAGLALTPPPWLARRVKRDNSAAAPGVTEASAAPDR